MHRTLYLTALFVSVFAATACEPSVKDDAYWMTKLTDPELGGEAAKALKSSFLDGKLKPDAQVAKLKELLDTAPVIDKEGRSVKEVLVYLLGKSGKAEAVAPIVDSIDFSPSILDDKETRKKAEMNAAAAKALGELGDGKAIKPLKKLIKAKEDFVQLAAIRALGKLSTPDAAEPLMGILGDDDANVFLNKNAIIALGELGAPKSIPALIRNLYVERKGVSFYREASYSLFQIGPAAVEPLVAVLEGKDSAVNALAKSRNIFEGAVKAKAAQILGDLDDEKAVKPLLAALEYKSEAIDMQFLVRLQAAGSLGRLATASAVKPLIKQLKVDEATARKAFADALNQIGDRSAVKAMKPLLKTGHAELRDSIIDAYTLLGTGAELDYLKGLAEKEKDEVVRKKMQKALPRLEVAKECGTDFGCLTGKLKDAKAPWRIRQKAAYEMTRLEEGKKACEPFLEMLRSDVLEFRFAVIWAMDRLRCANGGDAIAKQLEDEAGDAETVKVNEDLKRLLVKIKRRAGK